MWEMLSPALAYLSSCSYAALHHVPTHACGRKPSSSYRSAAHQSHSIVSSAFGSRTNLRHENRTHLRPSRMTSNDAFKPSCSCRTAFVPQAANLLIPRRHLSRSNSCTQLTAMSNTHSDPFNSEPSAQSSSDDHSLYEEHVQFPVHWRATLRLVTPYIRPANKYYTLLTVLSLCALFLSTAFKVLIPYIIKLILDSITDTKKLPIPLLGILFLTTCLVNILQFVRTLTYSMIECDSSRRFAIDIYHHLHMLCAFFHSNRRVGQLCKIIDKGTDALDTIVDLVLFTILPTYVSAARCVSSLSSLVLDFLTYWIASLKLLLSLMYSANSKCL